MKCPGCAPSDIGLFVLAKRAAATDEVEDSNVVKGNAVATIKQAVCPGARDLRALAGVLPAPPPPVGRMAVSLTAEHDDAMLQLTEGERAAGACL